MQQAASEEMRKCWRTRTVGLVNEIIQDDILDLSL